MSRTGRNGPPVVRLNSDLNPSVQTALLAVAFAVMYTGAAFVFREFGPDRGFSPLFPPAGIMFSLFIIGGLRWIPLAVVVRMSTIWFWFPVPDDSIVQLLIEAILITVSYAGCAQLLRTRHLARAHPAEFAWFAVVGVGLGPTLASLGLSVRQSITDDQSFVDAVDELRVFWVGDALAIAAIAPLTLVGLHALRYGRPVAKVPLAVAQRTEYALMVLAVAGAPVASSLFVSRGGPPAAVVFATLPLLWVALRQDLLQAAFGTAAAVVLVSVILRGALTFDELVEVQYLLLCGTVAAAFAATVRRAHEDTTASLQMAQDRFAQISRHAPIHFTEISVDGELRTAVSTGRSSNAISSNGISPDGQRSIDDGVVERWRRYGPVLVDRLALQEFSWKTRLPDERFLDSLALPVVSPTGALDHVLVVTSDRTNLRRANEIAERVQTHDAETGLMNRRGFRDLVSEPIEEDHRAGGVMVVSFHQAVDMVDGAVDEVLPSSITTQIATCISDCIGGAGTVARIGDQQFGVTTPVPHGSPGGVAALRELADSTLAALDSSTGPIARLPVSIGISGGRSTADETISRAERAARAAGELGGDRVLVYHPALHEPRRRRWASIEELRSACDRAEFDVHYQPIVRMSDRMSVGAEALLRWRHPSDGLLLPGAFIPEAERSGLIVRIDDLVCDTVARQLTEWIDADRVADSFTVSINISPVHMADPELANRLRTLSTRIDPRRIRIEITESAAMNDPDYTVGLLEGLGEIGYTIVLDDFGTGHSSMAWLHRFPVHALKIDRTFVSGLADDADARRIFELMVGLADDLGLSTTAEGIETEEEARLATELGCTDGQGYLFGRPAPPADAIMALGSTSPL